MIYALMPYIVGIIVCGLVYDVVVRAMRLRANGNARDAEALQELHKCLTRLEERIENIESIVIDHSQEQDFYRRLSS